SAASSTGSSSGSAASVTTSGSSGATTAAAGSSSSSGGSSSGGSSGSSGGLAGGTEIDRVEISAPSDAGGPVLKPTSLALYQPGVVFVAGDHGTRTTSYAAFIAKACFPDAG